jgi:hypothetical protein
VREKIYPCNIDHQIEQQKSWRRRCVTHPHVQAAPPTHAIHHFGAEMCHQKSSYAPHWHANPITTGTRFSVLDVSAFVLLIKNGLPHIWENQLATAIQRSIGGDQRHVSLLYPAAI